MTRTVQSAISFGLVLALSQGCSNDTEGTGTNGHTTAGQGGFSVGAPGGRGGLTLAGATGTASGGVAGSTTSTGSTSGGAGNQNGGSTAAGGATAGGTSGGGSAGGSVGAICEPGATRECLGPARCLGAQSCDRTGTFWDVCDCGAATGGAAGGGGLGGTTATGGNTPVSGSAGSFTAAGQSPGGTGSGGVLAGEAGGAQAGRAGTAGMAQVGTAGAAAGAAQADSAGTAGSTGVGCSGSTPDNPKVWAEFPADAQIDHVEALLPLASDPTQFIVGTQQIGAYCGGGTPAVMWKAKADPNGGLAAITRIQDLSLIQQYRFTIFQSAVDGTLFTGSGWCGYKPAYCSVDNGATWQRADSGSVHPPNSTFVYADFQGSTYVGTGYNPYDAEVYRWKGSGNWEKVFGQSNPWSLVNALGVFNNRLYVGRALNAGCTTASVAVYVSSNGSDFKATSGIDQCQSIEQFIAAGSTLYAWSAQYGVNTKNMYRLDETTDTWSQVSSIEAVGAGRAHLAVIGNTMYITLSSLGTGGQGIYATTDWGVTWNLVTSVVPYASWFGAFGNTLYWSSPAGAQPARLYCLPRD